jgi:two-component system, cell cycle sensor histidine kinase and response regulator CckA
MKSERISALLVEDSPADARLLREAVRDAEATHINLTHVDTLDKALHRLREEHFDVVMLDLSLPDAEGLDTLVRMHTSAPSVPIVVLTGLDDEALAVRAVREGAQDYLVKGQVTSQLLIRAMRYATERKRAVEALQRSEEYFRSLIENALDIITVIDAGGTIRYGSPSLKRVLGYEPQELIQQQFATLIHPDDQASVGEMLAPAQTNGVGARSLEFRIRHRNGTWRVLEAIGKLFNLDSASPSYVLNSRDITERKRDEEALRQANETLAAVIETSPLAIYTVDLKGSVTSWNTAAEKMYGYTQGEVMHRFLPILLAEDVPEFLEQLAETAKGRSYAGLEAKRRRKDDSIFDISVWSAPLRDGTGAVRGSVIMAADITDRKRLEEQFQQAQKMEAVGRLAGGVAHDFNNLLTVITGYCQMLLDRLEPSDLAYEDMQQVLRAADRATTLTKQLLAFSRKQIVQPKVIDLHALLREMDHILKRLVGEDIELHIEASAGLGKVRVDPGQLEQVIINLAVNSRDAMPKGGKLIIEMRNVEIDEKFVARHLAVDPGPYVLLAVTDTGAGIPPEVQQHLFEPFFTTKEKGRGTGLGLSTSYGIVKQNRGEILVYSEVGIGTTFKIYLPRVNEPADVDRTQAPEAPVRRGTETILIVEDEEGVRRVLLEMLSQQGYRVLVASSGPEAIALCDKEQGTIDLLITDVIMPKMSGRELADNLRACRAGLKVLFVSGYTDSAIVHHGILEEGTVFLQKPFTPEQIAGKVRHVLDEAPPIDTPSASAEIPSPDAV